MAEADPATLHAEADVARKRRGTRKTLLTGIAGAVLVGGLGFGGYQWFTGGRYVETENAYVGADTAQVTPMVEGQVTEVAVVDTQQVRRGQVLIRLDDRDARIALAEAEAALAKARREFGESSATSTALAAQVGARDADIARARAQLAAAQATADKARVDLQRRQALAPSGAVSGDELTSATNAFANAQAQLALARAGIAQAQSTRGAAAGELAANNALIRNVSEATTPDVRAAQARLDAARLQLERTVVRAPIDGVIASRSVAVGQRVAPGAAIMRVVPLTQVYVDANFKEGQLDGVAVGQPVTLTSDLYGDDVEFHGRVAGFSGGTGSSFALIPAQNATGNWIKVVQRLPVRIVLDPRELRAHPLRVGLSMTAEIDTGAR